MKAYENSYQDNYSWSARQTVLTGGEQLRIENIIDKYKNSDLTPLTYIKIQKDMEAEGLMPERLDHGQESSFNPSRYYLMMLLEMHNRI